MMKFIIRCIVILLLYSLVSLEIKAQCFFVTYKFITALPEVGINHFKKLNEEIPYCIYVLHTNGSNSSFRFSESYPKESVYNIFDMVYFKDFSKNMIHIVDYKSPDTIGAITQIIKYEEWEIYNDTILVNSQKCLKALRFEENGNLVTAYFLPAVKIFDGPLLYSGLPGLIVKLETVAGTYHLMKIEESNDCNVIIPEDEVDKCIPYAKWGKYVSSRIDSFIKY